VRATRRRKKIIDAAEVGDLPISPIDYMRTSSPAPATSFGEITGPQIWNFLRRPEDAALLHPSWQRNFDRRPPQGDSDFNHGELDGLF
jgi:hypothetical protein